ncbi:DUF1501 domain-containing protein [Gimesia fumaroli]|uniref:Sulfatase n=1 Tax=Gimesia fumaroli TaxID=2527976 RepID=A0A518IHE1_9PLAN|nr:DUF1501 domain-containing protein [Gimesia fumaroli]QDV52514.1 hypothetical protein Enr17x_45770 [Gimesia fumaroli]
MHCGQFRQQFTRRDMLKHCANGFGAAALTALLQDQAFSGVATGKTHFPPKAKNVIFLYMDGGPSQVDTFDPKPLLTKYNGKNPGEFFKVEDTQFDNVGKVLKSPWNFKQYSESGIPVSDLFPHIGTCVDDMAVIRSVVSQFPEHTFANYFLHTGSGLQGRPSMGAWVNYGLGSECQNLPGFVVVNGGLIPPGGLDCFNSGFLPASFQGSVFKPGGSGIANVKRLEKTVQTQQQKLKLMQQLDRFKQQQSGAHDEIESAISNYELAYKMQMAIPDLMSFTSESKSTLDLYGFNAEYEPTQTYAAECLLARRLVERGVRFVELTCTNVKSDRWDQHSNLKRDHENNARAVDQPIAGLLKDLKQRGLLDSTLVIWGGEFGRTPFAQGTNGRDHNPFGFSMWMAGGGIKGGTVYGTTDEWGYKVVENRVEIHDIHATMLHLLGLEHTKSTFRFGGRDMRLTDVHGHVVHDVIA